MIHKIAGLYLESLDNMWMLQI